MTRALEVDSHDTATATTDAARTDEGSAMAEVFSYKELARLDEALTMSSRETGLRFTLYIGDLGPQTRVRAEELFDFEYTLEMYKPAAKRRWGYFALPILHDDRLVGKVDAIADRKVSRLRVHSIHEDVRFTPAMTKAVHAELEDLASWLGLDAVERESA